MANLSLQCQLLCASQSAYAITPTSLSGWYNPVLSLPPDQRGQYQPQYDAVGFIGLPYVATALQIEAALIGKTANGIIIAFRGTLPPALNWDSFFDWLQDFLMPTVPFEYLAGEVHLGFLNALLQLQEKIFQAVRTLDPGNTMPVFITGHSKGGGIAPIAAMYFRNRYRFRVAQTITFAGPNPGNTAFANAYNAAFRNHVRYENYLDIVPLLPPDPEFTDWLLAIPGLPDTFRKILNYMKSYDYEPVGNLMYIDSNSVATAYTPFEAELLLPVRMAEIGEAIITLDLSAIGDAHHSGCGYRYMNAVCAGSGVCPV